MTADLVTIPAVFISITVITIALRIYTRTVILKQIGIDDCKLSQISSANELC
jgi:hypothetical protein